MERQGKPTNKAVEFAPKVWAHVKKWYSRVNLGEQVGQTKYLLEKDNKATCGHFKKELGSKNIRDVKEQNINDKIEQAIITDATNMENLKETYCGVERNSTQVGEIDEFEVNENDGVTMIQQASEEGNMDMEKVLETPKVL